MRIAVTGAAGVIGQPVVNRLRSEHEVIGIGRRPGPGVDILADLADLEATRRAVAGAEVVVHLAAAAVLDAPWERVLRDNIVATYDILEASRTEGVRRVVLASSHHVVGMVEEEALPTIYAPGDVRVQGTDAVRRPDSLYAVSKLFGEDLARYYHDRFGLEAVCIRIGVVRDDDDAGSPAIIRSVPWLPLADADRFARARAVHLSKRDAAELVARAVAADISWAVVYGTSDNPRQMWDPAPARDLLGYRPQDRPQDPHD